MEPTPDALYLDDRLFVLDIGTAQVRRTRHPELGDIAESVSSGVVDATATWTLTTRRNRPGYPPVRVNHFESISDLAEYVRRVEPTTPRRSLGGRSPDPAPSYEEYLEWLEENGLRGAFETKIRAGGYFTVPEWRARLSWEAKQLADHFGLPGP